MPERGISQGVREMIYSRDASLIDIKRVDYFEVDFLYSCGLIFENTLWVGVVNKTDISGNLYWSKRIEIQNSYLNIESLEIVTEGELFAVGTYSSTEGQFGVFMSLDGQGEILMAKSVETPGGSGLGAVSKHPNGNYIVFGGSGILEFDGLGNIITARRLETENSIGLRSMTIDENGDILVVGSYNDSELGTIGGLLVKLNDNLDIIWSKQVLRTVDLTPTPVTARDCANDGEFDAIVLDVTGDDYLEIASRELDIAAIKIDGMGDIVSETILDLGFGEFVTDVKISESGDLFLTGDIAPFTIFDPVQSYVLQLDPSLAVVNANNYASASFNLSLRSSAIIDDIPNYVASVGQTNTPQGYRGYQTHNLIGVDACTASAIDVTSYDPGFVLEDIELEMVDFEVTISDLVYDISDANNNLTVICDGVLSDRSPDTAGEPEIYPNPCVDYFEIEGLTQPSRIRVKDVLGRTVSDIDYFNGRVDTKQWPAGMYLVEIDGHQTYRVIKH
jgi:hypothetical protein